MQIAHFSGIAFPTIIKTAPNCATVEPRNIYSEVNHRCIEFTQLHLLLGADLQITVTGSKIPDGAQFINKLVNSHTNSL